MGRDKAFIILNGQPLAAHAASVLASGGCNPVRIVGRQAALTTLGWRVIKENGTDHHPLLGVNLALLAHPKGLVLVAPCDIVNLSVDHIAPLLSHGAPCVARSDDRVHPLLAIFPSSYAEKAAALAAKGAPAMALCEGLPVIDLPAPVLIDANVTTDLPR